MFILNLLAVITDGVNKVVQGENVFFVIYLAAIFLVTFLLN